MSARSIPRSTAALALAVLVPFILFSTASCKGLFKNLDDLSSQGPVDPDAGSSNDVDGECTSETDLAFCQRLGHECGEVVEVDNCGQARIVDCSAQGELGCGLVGACLPADGDQRQTNQCACPSVDFDADDQAICETLDVDCGLFFPDQWCVHWAGNDAVNCAGCSDGEDCGLAAPNVCGCPCTIGGGCQNTGDPSPDNPCMICDPHTSETEFSPAPDDLRCGDNAVCQSGQCVCEEDYDDCDDQCVDTQSNDDHCGGCGNVCGSRELCDSGQCVCEEGYQSCGGSCVDTSANHQYCGNCDIACGEIEVCDNGQCEANCADSDTPCGGACVDTTTDDNNCGSCDNACQGCHSCSEGGCVDDDGNCGDGESCDAGSCVECATDADCLENYQCIEGACVQDLVEVEEFHIQLTWTNQEVIDNDGPSTGLGTDLGLHYVHPDGTWGDENLSVYWGKQEQDWGSHGKASMDIDSMWGDFPENINHTSPLAGAWYSVGVHYYDPRGFGPSVATVRVYADVELIFEDTRTIEEIDHFWHVGDIRWTETEGAEFLFVDDYQNSSPPLLSPGGSP